ncbi:MAG: hypothetical protein ACP5VN_01895 [Acidobacteriota bacterium]
MRRLFFLLAFGLSVAAAAQGGRPAVKVVAAGDGASLWLPGETTPLGEAVASELTRRFLDLWKETFGLLPPLPDPLEVPRSPDLKESLFDALWRASAPALPPAEAPAARAAFRTALLGDPSALLDGMAQVSAEPQLRELPDPLLYLFLWDWAAERDFLAEALPPGRDRARLTRALHRRGVPYGLFLEKAAAWFFARAAEAGFLPPASSELPAVWLLDRDLPPGAFEAWTFSLGEGSPAVALSTGGPSGSLRIFLLARDPEGRLLQEGWGLPAASSFPLLPAARTVTVLLWNAGPEPSGSGLALTLWKSASPPFAVKEVERGAEALDLLLDEGPGVLDYRLALPGDEAASPPAFPSEGPGLHRYRVAGGGALEGRPGLRLVCRTRLGGRYEVPLPDSGDGPP